MLAKIPVNSILVSRNQLASLYISFILFGQVFVSLLSNALGIENRISMLAFRSLLMFLSYGFILFNLRKEKLVYFCNPWVISVLMFWLIYIARLLLDVHVFGVTLVLPVWELLAWSLGSSLPIAICAYLYAAQSNMNFISFNVVKYGIFMLGFSVILFLLSPGLEQGAFYLQHLNPITCANAGAALFLLCFSRVLQENIKNIDFVSSKLSNFLGTLIGLFIVVYSATRGAILAVGLIALGTIFCYLPHLRLSYACKRKYLASFLASLCFAVFTASMSSRLLSKLFTASAPQNIISRIELWRLSILEFISNPLFGSGFRMHEVLGGFVNGNGLHYPHNYLLESLSTGGIVLTIPFVCCVFYPIINFFKNKTNELSILPITLLLLQVFIYSMHNGHLGDFPFFWMMIGIVAGSNYRLKHASTVESN